MMQDECCFYRSGYKYQLAEDYHHELEWGVLLPDKDIDTHFIRLSSQGLLVIRAYYAWDGPSGPAIDTKDFIRGSLVHDALYQLMRQNHLDSSRYRALADQELWEICKEDGMSRLRAWWVWRAVRTFAAPCAEISHKKPVLAAPRQCIRRS